MFQGQFVICRLVFAIFNPHTKFEVRASERSSIIANRKSDNALSIESVLLMVAIIET